MNISEFATNYSKALIDSCKDNDELAKIYDKLKNIPLAKKHILKAIEFHKVEYGEDDPRVMILEAIAKSY